MNYLHVNKNNGIYGCDWMLWCCKNVLQPMTIQ